MKHSTHGSTRIRQAQPLGKSSRYKQRRLYEDVRWRKLSKLFLGKHPLCVRCHALDIITPADHVDHIIPHRGDTTLFYDETNWQALCAPCHGVKTSMETRGVSQVPNVKRKPADTVILICGSPGSGRLSYAREQYPDALVLDQASIAAAWSDSERHAARADFDRAAQAEVHRRLATLENIPLLVVILECPSHLKRRAWKKALSADEVVVVESELAGEWWSRYTRSIEETVVRV